MINTTKIIEKNEQFLLNAIVATEAHIGKLYAETKDEEGYAMLSAYCDMMKEAVQNVTDNYMEDANVRFK